jgi:hypothetical protein
VFGVRTPFFSNFIGENSYGISSKFGPRGSIIRTLLNGSFLTNSPEKLFFSRKQSFEKIDPRSASEDFARGLAVGGRQGEHPEGHHEAAAAAVTGRRFRQAGQRSGRILLIICVLIIEQDPGCRGPGDRF